MPRITMSNDPIDLNKERLHLAAQNAKKGSPIIYECVLTDLGYTFFRNVLADRLEYVRGEESTTNPKRPMSDAIEASILCQVRIKGLVNDTTSRLVMADMGNKRAYHPVRSYLAGLKWDGVDHIAKLSGYFKDSHDVIKYNDGSERTMFHALFRRWMLGAVGKAYDPAMNQNPVLVLDGVQRIGKSFFCQWLCPNLTWFFEGPIKPEDKDYWEYLAAHLVWEVSEIGSTMRKADLDALKHFITKKECAWRPAYGRRQLQKPALASFIGTLNDAGGFLDDPTGNTRFRPVQVMAIDYGYSKEVKVDQLWAQALHLYTSGETYKLSQEEETSVLQNQELYEVENPVVDRILETYEIDPTFTHIVWNKEMNDYLGDVYPKAKAAALKKLGCVAIRLKIQGNTQRGWKGLKPK
jgi:putative DNA primase/helicase